MFEIAAGLVLVLATGATPALPAPPLAVVTRGIDEGTRGDGGLNQGPADAGTADGGAVEEATAAPAPEGFATGNAGGLPPLPPEITADGLHEELRRAARERRALSAKVNEERTQLAAERSQLSKMAKDIEAARAGLRDESRKLQAQLDKRPVREPIAAAPTGRPTPGAQPVDQVSKTLKGMKPEQAAQVLLHLEPGLAVTLLAHMKPADAGPVLEKLKPEDAARLVAGLAARRLQEGPQ